MADLRADQLTKRNFANLAELTGARLWSQKSGEPDALGLDASELLDSNIVDAAPKNYVALTPAGFAASVATTDRAGIVPGLPTDAEVEAKTTDQPILSSQQAVMQAQWKKDFFIKNGAGALSFKDTDSSPKAVSFDVNYYGYLNNVQAMAINPLNISGYYAVYVHAILVVPSLGVFSSVNQIVYDTVAKEAAIGGSSFRLGLSANGADLYIRNYTAAGQTIRLSVHVNACLL